MKIEIHLNDASMSNDYQIYDNTNKRYLSKKGMFPRHFDLKDMLHIMTDRQILAFENYKYEFEISGKKLSLIDDYYYKPSFSLDRNYLIDKSKV